MASAELFEPLQCGGQAARIATDRLPPNVAIRPTRPRWPRALN